MKFRFRKQGHRFIYGPEPLESREMLSGHGLAHLSQLAALIGTNAARAQTQYVSSSVAGAAATYEGGCHGSQTSTTTLTAKLTDPNSTATGTATYSTSTDSSGTVTTIFNVSVTGATANSPLDVAIDGTIVGQITTDDNGAGSLALSSSPTGNQQALPANFPSTVTGNSVVTVGALTGTLAATNTSSHHAHLTAMLTDSSGTATGTAKFKSNTANGKTVLSISVTGAAANTPLDVAIDGTVVGQLTTDADGDGTLGLSSNPHGNQQALPANFPGVTSGSTITVGTLSGTFATSSGYEHSHGSAIFSEHFFNRRR